MDEGTSIFLMLIALALGLAAQAYVKSTYAKYGKVAARCGIPASAAIQKLMRDKGLSVQVTRVPGTLTDHYDPRSNTLALSEGVYDQSSVAALGIAAHEMGHALQKAENYPFLALRTAMVPVVNFGSKLAWPIFLIGILASWQPLLYAGIALFALVVLFTLVTLPVEFDASRRAVALLSEGGVVTGGEERGVRAMLRAAALTYVASFVSAAVQLLRLLAIANSSRRRR